MARLYRRGPTWYLDWHENGQRFRRSLGAIDRTTAQAVQAEKEAELAGLITPTRGVTVAQVIAGYLRWYEHARPTTFRRAQSDLRKFTTAFGPLAAEGVTPSQVEQWEVEHPKRATAHKALKLAKAAFRRALRSQVIRMNPLDLVQSSAPPISRAPSYYKPNELDKLYKAPRGPLWRFMVNTGIRRGEAAKARRSDVRGGSLYVESVAGGRTKSGKWRVIPLNTDARAALRKLGDDRLVDAHADTIGDWFHEDAAAAKLRGTLHWLRHTFCTALVQSGVSLYDVKVLAGHSSIQITERYAHHAPGHGRDVIEKLAEWHTSRHTARKPKPAKAKRRKLRPRSSAG
jgi:integrase